MIQDHFPWLFKNNIFPWPHKFPNFFQFSLTCKNPDKFTMNFACICAAIAWFVTWLLEFRSCICCTKWTFKCCKSACHKQAPTGPRMSSTVPHSLAGVSTLFWLPLFGWECLRSCGNIVYIRLVHRWGRVPAGTRNPMLRKLWSIFSDTKVCPEDAF